MEKISKLATLAILATSGLIHAECEYSDEYIREQEREQEVYESYQQDINDYIAEKEASPEYDTIIDEEEDCVTFTLVPRFTSDQRDYLTMKCVELQREAMDLMEQAEKTANQTWDVDVRAALMSIIGDAIVSMKGTAVSMYMTVTYCLGELSYHWYCNYPEWQKCKSLVTKAEAKLDTAKQIEERLWMDTYTNEDSQWIF